MNNYFKSAFPEEPESFHKKVSKTLESLSENKEMDIMKLNRKFTWKKAVVFAAVATMVIGTSAFAAGEISGYIGCTTKRNIYKEAPKPEKVEKDFGFSATIPESFSNGYTFQKADEGKFSSVDEAGNKLDTQKELDIDYEKDGNTISLYTSKCMDIDSLGNGATYTTTIGQTDVYYSTYENKTIPEDYEMTEQDKRDEESGKYVFSCADKGTKVKVDNVQIITWLTDGIEYSLLGINSVLTQEDFVTMAQEIIES